MEHGVGGGGGVRVGESRESELNSLSCSRHSSAHPHTHTDGDERIYACYVQLRIFQEKETERNFPSQWLTSIIDKWYFVWHFSLIG